MPQIIRLNMITADNSRRDRYNDNEEGEGALGEVRSRRVSVNVAAIRCYYPRKDERPGTRITFTDGGGFAVTEPYWDVDRLVSGEEVSAS